MTGLKKPSEQLRRWIELGAEPESRAVQSWARFYVYRMAVDVLAENGKQARLERLRGVPDHLRDRVESEARRVWALRVSAERGLV